MRSPQSINAVKFFIESDTDDFRNMRHWLVQAKDPITLIAVPVPQLSDRVHFGLDVDGRRHSSVNELSENSSNQ